MNYQLEKISDLLNVPSDKREECMRDLLYGLALHELAFGEQSNEVFGDVIWTDDGDRSVNMTDTNGDQILSLEITKAAA